MGRRTRVQSSRKQSTEPEVRRVEDVAPAKLDQVLGEKRHGRGPREDPPPAVHAPPVAVLGAGHTRRMKATPFPVRSALAATSTCWRRMAIPASSTAHVGGSGSARIEEPGTRTPPVRAPATRRSPRRDGAGDRATTAAARGTPCLESVGSACRGRRWRGRSWHRRSCYAVLRAFQSAAKVQLTRVCGQLVWLLAQQSGMLAVCDFLESLSERRWRERLVKRLIVALVIGALAVEDVHRHVRGGEGRRAGGAARPTSVFCCPIEVIGPLGQAGPAGTRSRVPKADASRT